MMAREGSPAIRLIISDFGNVICTFDYRIFCERLTRKTVDVLRLFGEFIVSYQVGALKPDPRIYAEALRRSGLPAAACVFVDDRPPCVEGAARVGMRALRFQSAEQLAADLARLGVALP